MKKSIQFLFLSFLLISTKIFSASYTFPNDLPSLGCTLWFGTTYQCTSNLTFSNNDSINVVSSMSISSGASFIAQDGLTITTNGNDLDMTIGGIFDIGNNLNATSCINIVSGGGVTIGNSGYIEGDLSGSSSVNLGTGTINEPCGGSITPRVDYHFDECVWDETAGEVKDSSGNNYDGISYNTDTSSEAKINRAGDFSEDSDKDYVSLDYLAMNGLDSFSVGVWVKTSDTSSQQEILQALGSSANDDEFELYLYGNNKIRINIKDHGENFNIATNKITNGYWHQIFVTREKDTICLYIDGVKQECKSGFETGILSIHENSLIVGQEQDSYGGNFSASQNFVGLIDELKIFDDQLQENQIKEIYDYENSGKNYDGTTRDIQYCPLSTAYVDYKFNECGWNGAAEEVKDSSGNNLNATAIKTTTVDGGKLCRAGDFTAIGTEDYIVVPKEAMDGLDDFTFSVWVNTSVDKSEQNIIQGLGSSANDDEFQLYIKDDDTLKLSIMNEQHTCDIGFSITDGIWHQIVIVREGGTVKYYVDGLQRDSSDSYPQGALSITDGTLIIGQEQDSFGGSFYSSQALEGKLDEIKIFKSALPSDQVKTIYDNEKNDKNYDGSPSQCIVYNGNITPLEFEGAEITLATTTNAPHWTHVDFNQTFASIPVVFVLPEKTGSHPASVRLKNITVNGFDAVFAEPQGEDGPHLAQNINFLAVNKGIHKIGDTYFEVGTVDTQKVQQKNVLNEWKKIDSILEICSPAVVGQIQSLNNEVGLDTANDGNIIRSIPWMTTVIDVNSSGVYMALERSETTEGNINSTETIGYMISLANIQDSVIDDNNKNIKFETIVKKDYFVGWDDSCKSVNFVNTYSKIPLVAANKNSRNGQDGGWFRRCNLQKNKIGLQIDEDRAMDTERNHIEETGSIFVFSDTIVIHEDQNLINSFFDAWDIFRDITDRKISTKKASQNFSLSIASLTEDNSALQDYNGTVCVRLVGETNSTWNKVELTSNPKDTIFSVNRADKDTRVEIAWKDEVDEACPVSNETNSTMSSDNFAIRPDKFNLTLPTLAYAGENFNINFDASSVVDYNETLGLSFHVESNISKSVCFNGTLHVEPFSFENGVKSVDVNYTDIGDINITIKEILGSEFAVVDKNDTSDEDRLISPDTKDMTIKPYELNVTNVEYEEGWLYMADVIDINQSVKFSVLANDKQHNLVQNFTDVCYSEDVDVQTYFTIENTNNNVEIKYDDSTVVNIADINRTITIPKVSFVNSKADIEYSFNIERDYKTPYEPIKIGLREVSVESSNVAKVENNVTVSLDRNFYYGRVKTQDLSTNEQSTPHSLHVEVFRLGKYKQSSLNWYINEADTNTTVTFTPKTNFNYSSTNSDANVTNIAIMSKGEIGFDMTNNWDNSNSAMIHLDVPIWLWYSKYNSYNSAVDCASHPCFEYRYVKADASTGIQSGSFKGSSIGDDYNSTKSKIGVKTFR